TVPDGKSWCDACHGPAQFSSRELGLMRGDIRARILWGDPIKEIREAWLAKGAPGAALKSALEDALRERRRHFRMRGALDLLVALLCFVIGAASAWFQYAFFHGQIEFAVPTKGMGILMVTSLALPMAGLHFSFRGVRRLTSGGSDEKSASDLSEFDFFDKD